MDHRVGSRRLELIRRLSAAEGAPLVVTQQKNISWLLGGRSHVNIASEPGCCMVVVAGGRCTLVANNIESARLQEEEIEPDALDGLESACVWNWFEPADKERIVRELTAGLGPPKTDVELEARFQELRSAADEERWDDWRQLGLLTSEAIEQAALELARGDSETKIAGRLAYQCYERGLEPIVNLVAVDERASARRHPLPTGKTLDTYAMLVVCARSGGKIASATRLVHFGAVPEPLARKFRAVIEIDARLNDATTEAKPLGKLFDELTGFYRDAGFPDEYKRHHQGGLTGYATREKLAAPGEAATVKPGQLYAWNPSIEGVKSEDTMMVRAEGNTFVTPIVRFPSVDIRVGDKTYARTGILQRSFL